MFIYGLFSPSGELRYVGKTVKTPAYRLSEHLRPAMLKRDNSHKANWLKLLKRQGQRPTIRVIQELPEEYLSQAEIYWIAYFKSQGCNLVNGTDGGEGTTNRTPISTQGRANISKAQLGRKRSLEEIALMTKNQPTRKPIVDQNGTVYTSIKAAAKILGLTSSNVARVVKGERKQTGGYIFRLHKD